MALDFLEWVEYPDNNDLMAGPKEDIVYSYVSTTYLNGFINYVGIVGGFMARRGKVLERDRPENAKKEDLSWEESCALIDKGHQFHTDVSDCYKYDDIHVLGVCGEYYYYFISDRDCSDSCIGKFKTSRFKSHEEALAELKNDILEGFIICDAWKEYVHEHEDEYIKRIPPEFFKGWITL